MKFINLVSKTRFMHGISFLKERVAIIDGQEIKVRSINIGRDPVRIEEGVLKERDVQEMINSRSLAIGRDKVVPRSKKEAKKANGNGKSPKENDKPPREPDKNKTGKETDKK